MTFNIKTVSQRSYLLRDIRNVDDLLRRFPYLKGIFVNKETQKIPSFYGGLRVDVINHPRWHKQIMVAGITEMLVINSHLAQIIRKTEIGQKAYRYLFRVEHDSNSIRNFALKWLRGDSRKSAAPVVLNFENNFLSRFELRITIGIR